MHARIAIALGVAVLLSCSGKAYAGPSSQKASAKNKAHNSKQEDKRPFIAEVIELYVTDSPDCESVARKFEAAQANHPNVKFTKLDGNAPENADKKKSWGIHSYPSFVYINSKGTMFEVHHHTANTTEDIEGWLKVMNATKQRH